MFIFGLIIISRKKGEKNSVCTLGIWVLVQMDYDFMGLMNTDI